MFEAKTIADIGKPEIYHELGSQLHALLSGESDQSPMQPTPRR